MRPCPCLCMKGALLQLFKLLLEKTFFYYFLFIAAAL